jgi:hypothetical protein
MKEGSTAAPGAAPRYRRGPGTAARWRRSGAGLDSEREREGRPVWVDGYPHAVAVAAIDERGDLRAFTREVNDPSSNVLGGDRCSDALRMGEGPSPLTDVEAAQSTFAPAPCPAGV